MRKSDKHIKTPSWFANTKVYTLLHFLEVVGGRETEYENWIDRISKSKRNKTSRGERELRQTLNFFWFSVVVLTCLFVGFVSTPARLVWDPFSELTFKWGPQLSPVFILHISSSTVCLYLVTSGRQLTLLLFSITCQLLTAFQFESLSANQNPFQFAANTFLFLIQVSLIILHNCV